MDTREPLFHLVNRDNILMYLTGACICTALITCILINSDGIIKPYSLEEASLHCIKGGQNFAIGLLGAISGILAIKKDAPIKKRIENIVCTGANLCSLLALNSSFY